MSNSIRKKLLSRRWLPWIVAGIVLRALFICFPRPVDDDTWDYLMLGHNLLHQGIYGVGSGANISPTLFRLPAYPIILATFEQIFAGIWPHAWLNTVFIAQVIADVAAALLLAAFAYRHLSPRAGEIALALAMLCPFTAVYASIAMTECFSVFAVALGVYAVGRALAAEAEGRHDLVALLLAGSASALAMLLRPDGAVLFFALLGGLVNSAFTARVVHGTGPALKRSAVAASIVCLVALLPISVWTIRNWAQFHVFQPLAPRYLNDPGDRPNIGVYSWLRTWSVEYVTTATVFWSVGVGSIDPASLPPRAFDTPEQREATLNLISDYNLHHAVTPQLDNRFAALAAERIHAHPFRYYLSLPVLRLADMLLRPRTEEFDLDVFWWRWNAHPSQTLLAVMLGLFNLFYVATAAWAFLRGRVPWAWMPCAYLLIRFVLLGSLENPEPRYTVECFPIFIIAAAAVLSRSGIVEPTRVNCSRISQTLNESEKKIAASV